MKKILCFILVFLLSISSVCTVYAESSDSEHGGTGGSVGDGTSGSDGDHGGTGGDVGWNKLPSVDSTIADQVVIRTIAPSFAGAVDLMDKLLNTDDLDEDTTNYIKENAKDNVTTDGTYYYINPTFIQNINQKVQSRVHALDGYYLVESQGAFNYANLNSIYKKSSGNSSGFDNYEGNKYIGLCSVLNNFSSVFYVERASRYYGIPSSYYKEGLYFYLKDNQVRIFNTNTNSSYQAFGYFNDDCGTYSYPLAYIPYDFSNISFCLGDSQKVFYSIQDIRNYLNQGQHYYPNIPSNKTIKVAVNYTNVTPTLNLDFDISGKLETEIQGQLDLAFNAWLDKLAEIDVNPSNPTPTPGSSSGGSGSGHGGTGGDFDTPTPTPNPDDGFISDTGDVLQQIYEWLVSFGEKHDIFAKTITDYIEANDGKLDQIIEAINGSSKYDFSALSDFLGGLWNDSDQKFDTMIKLLEENNKYQQKLVDSLNEIKAILVTQTVLDLFQDRSSETANKAKEKFPTSIPWDVAMIVNAMAAEPQPIKLSLPVKIASIGIDEEIIIDLTGEEWEKLAKTCRYLLSILFILFMIHLSRKMFFNGRGDD